MAWRFTKSQLGCRGGYWSCSCSGNCCALFQAVWIKLGSKRLLWERMRALFYAYALTSMCQLLEALLYGFTKSSPLVAIDSA